MLNPVIETAARAFGAYLKGRKGVVDISDVTATGRWVVHSGFFGSSDSDPTYLFEVKRSDGETEWIDELGLIVADDIQEYFADAV